MKNRLKKIIGIAFIITALTTLTGQLAFAHDDGTSHEHTAEEEAAGEGSASYPPETPSGSTAGSTTESSSAAADTSAESTELPFTPEGAKTIVNGATFLLWIEKFLNRLLWPLLFLIGGLMDNSLLFEGGMDEQLLAIWRPIRNIVNILFVLGLVGVALYNVLGLGDENSEYSIKTILPKLIVAVIAINFSYLGIRVVLDGIDTLTTGVFSIPGQVVEGLDKIVDTSTEEGQEVEKRLCTQIQGLSPKNAKTMKEDVLIQQQEKSMYDAVAPKYLVGSSFNIRGKAQADIEAAITATGKKAEFDQEIAAYEKSMLCSGYHLTPNGTQYLNRFDSSNAALAMALNMGKIVFYQDLPIEEFKDLEKVAINALFSVLMYIAYAASFIALFVILLARLIVLWLSIALSPVLLLLLVGPAGLKEKIGDLGKISEQFTKMAIAPLIVAISMASGWIMLRAIQGLNGIGQADTLGMGLSNGIPVVGLTTLQDVMVALGTIAVVWIGVFSAASGTIAQGAVEAIKGGVQTAAGWAAKIPLKHMPLVPIKLPGEDHAEPYTVSQVGEALHEMKRQSDREDRKLAEKLFPGSQHSKPEDISRARDPQGLYNALKDTTASDLTSSEYLQHLKKLKKEQPRILDELDARMKNNINRLLNEKTDEKDKPKIAKEIIADAARLAGTAAPAAGSPGAGTPPTGAPKTPEPTAFTIKDTIGGGKINDAEHVTAINSQLNGLKLQLGELAAATTDEQKTEHIDLIRNILTTQLKVNDKTITPDELKKYITTDEYKIITGNGLLP